MQPAKRPRVLHVTVTYEVDLPDGTVVTKTATIPGKGNVGVLWAHGSDRAEDKVVALLSDFYAANREQRDPKGQFTHERVKALWHKVGDGGSKPAFVVSSEPCVPYFVD